MSMSFCLWTVSVVRTQMHYGHSDEQTRDVDHTTNAITSSHKRNIHAYQVARGTENWSWQAPYCSW